VLKIQLHTLSFLISKSQNYIVVSVSGFGWSTRLVFAEMPKQPEATGILE